MSVESPDKLPRSKFTEHNYSKLLTRRPKRLYKNKIFWVGACSGWVLNQNWMLIEKIKKTKSVRQVIFSINHKFHVKFLSKLIIKFFVSLQFRVAPDFNSALKWTWALVKSFSFESRRLIYLLALHGSFTLFLNVILSIEPCFFHLQRYIDEKEMDVLQTTEKLLSANPDVTTVWNIRKEILQRKITAEDSTDQGQRQNHFFFSK